VSFQAFALLWPVGDILLVFCPSEKNAVGDIRALASVINKTPKRLSRPPQDKDEDEDDERECSREAARPPTHHTS
jgi:replicative superfamily II helicase